MNILYITSHQEDYLQDVFLIGFRQLLGAGLLDYPKKDVVYQTHRRPSSELYGNGFTVWKLLDDIDINRQSVVQRVWKNEFDLIVFGSIWRQQRWFWLIRAIRLLRGKAVPLVVLDGEDSGKIYRPALAVASYYKRELNAPEEIASGIKPISFAIPNVKLRTTLLAKEKSFARHVQCDEAYQLEEIRENCQKSYAFTDEAAYYHDIAVSKYAVTMKKAGWDCMRHYEIAANGTVPCFFQLNDKSTDCAPHGLVDMKNVIAFDNAAQLQEKLDTIERASSYAELQQGAVQWAQEHSTAELTRVTFKNLLP